MSNILIEKLLSIPASEAEPLSLHAHIVAGFPAIVFEDLAAELGMSIRAFSKATGIKAPDKRDLRLSAEASDHVYRITQIVADLARLQNWGTVQATTWLGTPCGLLRLRIPFDLLRTRPGYEYVATAVTRLSN